MPSFIIEGGHRLQGEITPKGAKNEALEVICATLLTRETVTISNVPEILDVLNLIQLLESMGVEVGHPELGTFTFRAADLNEEYMLSADFQRRSTALRGSIMMLGPLIARTGHAQLPQPGGDKIGRRRLDTHLIGLQTLGATFTYDGDRHIYRAEAPEGGLEGCYMLLDEASVTGTANLVMAAALANGTTTIYNAACEPYVQQLCRLLVKMGAQIDGIGSNLLRIHGVNELHGAEHRL
ncbi:MAG: UDP-N-acetylglucosamine 1-carboxyvinyltransferase, partial [Bacteroidales bacterium]|nr:UDP-N-acetylglucosamine 1-carboxyvinyltransferase [Bacteroidales bacterium]